MQYFPSVLRVMHFLLDVMGKKDIKKEKSLDVSGHGETS